VASPLPTEIVDVLSDAYAWAENGDAEEALASANRAVDLLQSYDSAQPEEER